MKNKFPILVLLSTCILASCGRTVPAPSERYMVLDEVCYIDEFPQSYQLENATEVVSGALGARSFAIFDSLMFIQTTDPDGLWRVYALPQERLIGSFFRKGNGPGEFIWPPAMNHTDFQKEDGRIVANIFDHSKNRVVSLDVTEMLRTGDVQLSMISDRLDRYIINCIRIDDKTLFCRELSDQGNQLPRYLLKGKKKKVVPDNLEKLNRAKVNIGEDHNIMAADIKYDRQRRLILETPTMLDQINIYSPDGTYGKTICTGRKVDDIEQVQSLAPGDRVYSYDGARIFPDFFAALRCNEDVNSYETERKVLPVIQVFDWDGNPIAELKLDRFCTSFAIDTINGYVYIFNNADEGMYKYDIQDILPGFTA